MPANTTVLNLVTYNTTVDASSVGMYTYCNTVSGSTTGQNLGKLDRWAGEVSASLTKISGSFPAINTRVTRPHSAVIQIVPATSPVTETTGVFNFHIPSELDTMNLVRARAFVNTPGTTGSMTTGSTLVLVTNQTKYSSASAARIKIESGSTVSVLGALDLAKDDVSTDDNILIAVVISSASKALGLQVVLEYNLP